MRKPAQTHKSSEISGESRTRKRPLSLAKACAAVLASSAVLPGSSSQAGTFYWTGDNGSLWNQSAGLAGTNWSSSPDFNNGTAGLPGAGDDVFFNLFGAGSLNTELGQSFAIQSLTFTPDATNSVTIGDTPATHTLTIGGGGIKSNTLANGANTYTISAGVVLGANQTWTNNNALAANALNFSGPIGDAGLARNLILSGVGTFNFTGANTYTGTTTLGSSGTTLTLRGANGSLSTSTVALENGTTLNIDNTSGNNTNRVADSVGISAKGATIALKGPSATETVGTLTLPTGSTSVNVDTGSTLTFGSLSPAIPSISRSVGGTVNFSTTGTVVLANQATTNGIIGGWATIGSLAGGGNLDWAVVPAGGGPVTALAVYETNAPSATTTTENTKLSDSTMTSPAGNSAVNSLYLTGTGGLNFTGGADTLTVASGGIIANGGTLSPPVNGQPVDYLLNANVIGSGASNGRITSGSGDLIVNAANNLQINSVITGGIGLTKSGAGILDLSNGNGTSIANTYTGATTVNGGVLVIRADSNLGTVPGSLVTDSIRLNGGEIRSTATFPLNANRGITVGTAGGTISYVGGSTVNLNAPVTGVGSFTLKAAATSTAGGGPNLVLNNSNNTYQGATTLMATLNPVAIQTGQNAGAGIVRWGVDNAIPDSSAVTLVSQTATASTTGVPRIDMNGKSDTIGSLAGNTVPIVNFNSPGGLTVGGNGLSTEYAGNITGSFTPTGVDGGYTNGNPGTGSFTKVGTGSQILSGQNNYTGATTIHGGALLIGSGAGTTSSASLANSAVTVGNGTTLAGSLGGNGTINGTVLLTSTGHLAPAMSTTTFNTLTIANNLTLNAGATLDYNFGTTGGIGGVPGSSDLTNITGAGNVLVGGNITLNVTPLAGFGIGIYKILDAGNSAGTFSFSGTAAINGSTAFNYSLVSDGQAFDPSVGGGNAGSKQVYLQVLQGNPTFFWTGNVDPGWNTATANWTSASSGSLYTNASNVTFDDGQGSGVAPTSTTVAVQAGGVSPNTITFGNAVGNYVFSGGSITVGGTGGIVKNQAGNVTFNNDVTSRQLTVSGGTLSLGAGKTLTATNVSNAVTVNSGGTVGVNGILKADQIQVNAGGVVNANAGAALLPNAASGISATVNGVLTLSNGSQSLASLNGSGSVTLNSTALTLSGASAFTGTIGGANGSVLLNSPTGIVTLSGANTYAGGTTVTAGSTLVVNNSVGSATGTGVVNVSGTLTGVGTVSGHAMIASGGHLAPGTNGVGSMNLGQLTLDGGASLNSSITGSGANTANSGTLTFGSPAAITLNITGLGDIGLGPWNLATATGSVTGFAGATFNVAKFGTANSPAYVFSPALVNAGSTTHLQLAVSIGSYTFNGNTSANWDTTTTNNWSSSNPSGLNTFGDGGFATFSDTNTSANNNITLVGSVRTSGLTVTNALAGPNPTYTIGNGGTLAGAGGVTKNGTGILILNGNNTFLGKTIVNGGTLSIAGDSGLGAVPASAVADQLTLNGGTTLKVTVGTAANAGAGVSTLAANRGITLGSGSATIDTTAITHTAAAPATNELGTENSFVYNGVLTGPGGLTVIGSGGAQANSAGATAPQTIINLGAVLTYQGDTTIDNAILQVNSGNTGTTGGGTFQLDNVLPTTTTLNLINNGSFNMASSTSDLTVAGLNGDATGRIGSSNAGSAAVLTLNGSGSYSFPGTIGGQMVAGKQGNDTTVSVVKAGSGTQVLGGVNTYLGTTTVSDGRLIISGAISGSVVTVTGTGRLSVSGAAGAITVESGMANVTGTADVVTVIGGSLMGTGTVGVVNVITGGTVHPGNSVGSLNSADLFLNLGGSLAIEIASATAFGRLNVTGGVLIEGQLLDMLQYPASAGDTFFIVSNDSTDPVTGTFANVVDNGNGTGTFTSPSGPIYRVSYSSDFDTSTFTQGSGNDIALQVISVPEPSTALAFLGGMGCLLGMRRSRRWNARSSAGIR